MLGLYWSHDLHKHAELPNRSSEQYYSFSTYRKAMLPQSSYGGVTAKQNKISTACSTFIANELNIHQMNMKRSQRNGPKAYIISKSTFL